MASKAPCPHNDLWLVRGTRAYEVIWTNPELPILRSLLPLAKDGWAVRVHLNSHTKTLLRGQCVGSPFGSGGQHERERKTNCLPPSAKVKEVEP